MEMTKEWIEERIKLAHENTVDKGFYDCPECGGYGENEHKVSKNIWIDCETCNDTRIDPNKNIGELLMLIVSELGEALEAHRCGRFCNKSSLVNVSDYPEEHHKKEAVYLFEMGIKDTFEDEIADVFIRLFDLCGYLGIEIKTPDHNIFTQYANMGEQIFFLDRCVHRFDSEYPARWAGEFYTVMVTFCTIHNIPIQKHIEAKMAYNKTRPRKHGKEY